MAKKDKKNKAAEAETETKPREPMKVTDVLTLRRKAKEVKRHVVVMRVLGLLVIILVAIIAIAYAISYFYDKYGSFTVKISKYDMMRQGLTLSEVPEYNKTNAVLNADIVYDMTNISGEDLPDNIDMENGSHNGESYIAYTFYLINAGDDTISYDGEMTIENVTNSVDEAVRVAVYINGKKTVYGKTKSDGTGKEGDCDSEFTSSTVVMTSHHEGFEPQAKDKYTVVIWLEGNDPDCTDELIGGTLKLGMDFKIVETT